MIPIMDTREAGRRGGLARMKGMSKAARIKLATKASAAAARKRKARQREPKKETPLQ